MLLLQQAVRFWLQLMLRNVWGVFHPELRAALPRLHWATFCSRYGGYDLRCLLVAALRATARPYRVANMADGKRT